MADNQFTTPTFIDSGLSRLCRSHAVERLAIEREIQTLMITAGYARDVLTVEGLDALPEDFFTCIEEMKELMESIDLKSLDFEKRTVALKRKKRRLARAPRQNCQ